MTMRCPTSSPTSKRQPHHYQMVKRLHAFTNHAKSGTCCRKSIVSIPAFLTQQCWWKLRSSMVSICVDQRDWPIAGKRVSRPDVLLQRFRLIGSHTTRAAPKAREVRVGRSVKTATTMRWSESRFRAATVATAHTSIIVCGPKSATHDGC